MSQKAEILRYLLKHKPLTPIEALDRFGCFRLAARVQSLRDQGHRIKTRMVPVGNGKRVAEYYLG